MDLYVHRLERLNSVDYGNHDWNSSMRMTPELKISGGISQNLYLRISYKGYTLIQKPCCDCVR